MLRKPLHPSSAVMPSYSCCTAGNMLAVVNVFPKCVPFHAPFDASCSSRFRLCHAMIMARGFTFYAYVRSETHALR